jgi:Family of unknown function (DUF6069)
MRGDDPNIHAAIMINQTTTMASVTRRPRWLSAIAAAAAALILWTVVDPIGGLDLTVGKPGATSHIGAVSVILAALISCLIGWALLSVFERTLRRPARLWTITATVVFLLSLAVGPVNGTDGGDKLALAGLHLIVAAVVIPWLRASAASRRPLVSGDLG